MKIRLYLEICSACNLKCKYCFEKDYVAQFIDSESLYKFVDTIKPLIGDIVITGGEPTLHTDFFEIIEHFSEYTDIVITSNGTLLDLGKIRDMLSKHSNVRLQFSLDAINRDYVDYVRGNSVYDRVMHSIIELKDYYSQLSISSTLTTQTSSMIRDIYAFAKEHRINCYFPSLLPYGALVYNWNSMMPEVEEYIQLEDTLIEIISDDELDIIHSNKLDIILSNVLEKDTSKHETFHVIKVDAFGHILSCPATDYSNITSRIANIDTIHSAKDLENLLINDIGCVSANLISQECENCEIEKYCRRLFCGNCIHLEAPNISIVKYLCKTFKHHYTNIKATMEV